MHLPFGYFIGITWVLWALYWAWGARRVKAAARVDSVRTLLTYRLPVALGFTLLIALGQRTGDTWLYRHVPSAGAWVPGTGWLLVLLGLGFACWARYTLGRNWSGDVQLKQGHELVTHGPYRWVRHPIYTGMLLGMVGTILATGAWLGLLALALVGGGFWYKLRHEERWMREQFGETYVAYMRRTKALIPGVL